MVGPSVHVRISLKISDMGDLTQNSGKSIDLFTQCRDVDLVDFFLLLLVRRNILASGECMQWSSKRDGAWANVLE